MSRDFPATLAHLEAALGHRFATPDLLREALTHRSTTSRRDELGYERLEFLGDRVLGLCVAAMLYRHFPTEAEGKLAVRHTDLVRRETLAEVARLIDLGDHIAMSRDAQGSGARENATVLSDVMEALLGALFIDGGLAAAEACVEDLWSQRMRDTQRPPRDAKTRLQEWALGRGLPLPAYAMIDRTGPDHAPTITVTCTVQGVGETRAQGGSKRAAEQSAAEDLLARAQQGERT
ncbi:MAG: ribonuclease III [Proteobacteria bacterium]|nr:ribonuclease III [Pseudomonadota bacterium]MDA1070520.1 ribonuclease III [Pseudomonadota bacterium]